MSKKIQRVTRKAFDTILAKGKTHHSPHLSLKIYIASEEILAISFVVSKKIAKKAVTRNLLKRRGRAILQKAVVHIHKPHIGAFFFKKGAEKLSFHELEEEITQLLKKARIIL